MLRKLKEEITLGDVSVDIRDVQMLMHPPDKTKIISGKYEFQALGLGTAMNLLPMVEEFIRYRLNNSSHAPLNGNSNLPRRYRTCRILGK